MIFCSDARQADHSPEFPPLGPWDAIDEMDANVH
jgi:hypothetical protein